MSTIDPNDYLIQYDAYPPQQLTYWASCARQWSNWGTTFRKMDFGQDDPAAGYQYSDAVLYTPSGVFHNGWIEQTFAFGDGPYNAARGDGGNAIKLLGGVPGYGNIARIVFTEDGGGGRQIFAGDNWWLFDDQVTTEWRLAWPKLSIQQPGGSTPPLNQSFTRWRRVPASAFKVLTYSCNGQPREEWWAFDVIQSEHYASGVDIASSVIMERFFFAKGFGNIRWEAWSKLRPAEKLGLRAPWVSESVPPAPGWNMVDCRQWTNFKLPPSPSWTVDQFGWPLEGIIP